MNHEVLLADDHAIIRDGLKKLLADVEGLEVAGEAADGQRLLELVRARPWDVLVLDISMPGRSGIELIKMIKSERPGLPILVFSMHLEEQYALRAIRAGASGYLSKGGNSEDIVPAIRKVAGGGLFISPKVAELLAADLSSVAEQVPHKRLSDREFEVFRALVQGVAVSQIARQMNLSIKTVSTHKSRIMDKMEMQTSTELIRYAMAHHLLDDAEGPPA